MAANTGFTVEDSKFESGTVYRFKSARDNEFVDLWDAKMADGSKVCMYQDYAPHQQWKAVLDDESEVPRGHFLATQFNTDMVRVLTLKPIHQGSRVVLEEYKGKLEQLWFMIPNASTGTMSIVNAYNGNALCNQGREQNCRCIDINPDDINQQWRPI